MMDRLTETKLEKIVLVGFGMIDHHLNTAIKQLDELKKEFEPKRYDPPVPVHPMEFFALEQRRWLNDHQNSIGQLTGFCGLENARNGSLSYRIGFGGLF